LIRQRMPDALGLDCALWSRGAVQELVRQRFGLAVAVPTMGRYLARWGCTPQKPLRRASEQAPAAVRCWRRRAYPAIAARAKAEKGVIFGGDEGGRRSDDVRGRSHAPRGETPVVRPCHKRASVGLLSAVSNKGELRGMVLDGAIQAPTLMRFLERLVRDAGRKLFLILDRRRVHRARLVRDWLEGRQDRIEVFHLPACSPDLDPDAGRNGDVKQAVTAKPPARSKAQLKRAVIGHMRSLSRRPQRIRAFCRNPPFRYPA
jgi:DDE superfamily endonuclease/Winged helix-turn helix